MPRLNAWPPKPTSTTQEPGSHKQVFYITKKLASHCPNRCSTPQTPTGFPGYFVKCLFLSCLPPSCFKDRDRELCLCLSKATSTCLSCLGQTGCMPVHMSGIRRSLRQKWKLMTSSAPQEEERLQVSFRGDGPLGSMMIVADGAKGLVKGQVRAVLATLAISSASLSHGIICLHLRLASRLKRASTASSLSNSSGATNNARPSSNYCCSLTGEHAHC